VQATATALRAWQIAKKLPTTMTILVTLSNIPISFKYRQFLDDLVSSHYVFYRL
jgi:hypothetical protein